MSSSDQLGRSELKQYYIQPNKDNIYESFSLSSVQQAYLMGREDVFDFSDYGTHLYFESLFNELDHEQLEMAFNLLVQRHHMLRVIFANGRQQFLEDTPDYKIKYLTDNNIELHAQIVLMPGINDGS